MDVQDLNNSLNETVRTLWDNVQQLEALEAKAKELHDSEENRLNFEYAIPRLERASQQIREAIKQLPANFNG